MKKKPNIILALALAALLSAAMDIAPAQAANGCAAAGARVAAQSGGQVIGTRLANQGGQKVCVITLLIADPTGSRPASRKTVTVAAN